MKKLNHKQKTTNNKLFLLIVGSLFLLTFILASLVAGKKVSINQIFVKSDAVKGIDVSHYQGEINWDEVEKQNVRFAFIKATEGSSYVDETFTYNWKNATESGIATGAYHFFSFDSPAESQAELYISTVGDLDGHLVPVVDVEYYGDKEENPPSVDELVPQLQQLLSLLEQEYQVKPMLYTTYKVYYKYLKDNFTDYPLWIRNVYYPPMDIDQTWTFWQYSDKGKMTGMKGREEYVDLNAFKGTEEELRSYLIKTP